LPEALNRGMGCSYSISILQSLSPLQGGSCGTETLLVVSRYSSEIKYPH